MLRSFSKYIDHSSDDILFTHVFVFPAFTIVHSSFMFFVSDNLLFHFILCSFFFDLIKSNLPYVGKLIEQIAIEQIDMHLFQNNLHEPLQSAYTQYHSTGTAVVKVTNDILSALAHHQ